MGKFYVPRHQTSNFTHQTKKGLVVERQVLFHYPQEGGFYEEIHGDTGFLYAFYGFFPEWMQLVSGEYGCPHRDEPGFERQGDVLFDFDRTGHRTGQGYGQ